MQLGLCSYVLKIKVRKLIYCVCWRGSYNLGSLCPKIAVYKLSITTINDLLFSLWKLYNLNRFFEYTQIHFITHNLPLNVSIQRHLGLIYYLQNPSQVNHITLLSAVFDSIKYRMQLDTLLPNLN